MTTAASLRARAARQPAGGSRVRGCQDRERRAYGRSHRIGRAVLDDVERRAQHVANPQRDRAGVVRRVCAVEQVGDHPVAAGRIHLFGNALADLRRHERDAAPRASQPLDQLASVREDDEAALGARDLESAVEHDREHLVEHFP